MFARMKSNFLVFLFLFFFCYSGLDAQIAIPKDYFAPPLGIKLSVTGTFGEVRPDHFHSGVDFSVMKKEGMPVYAVADGWVSRIKISPVGFGNALYLDHPNGFTSVYGHLSGYIDTVRAYAHQKQYLQKSFEVDLFPAHDHDTIYVKKGDVIGYAGNSGGSFGAHLHFELRNTVTERIINPLLFGLTCADLYPPYISFAKIYPVDELSVVSGSSDPLRLNIRKADDTSYQLTGGDTLNAWGNFAIGVEAFDFLYSNEDRNGWYSLSMYFDNAPFFSMQIDSFAFSESKCVNGSLDYAANYWDGRRIIRSVRLPGNTLDMHHAGEPGGIISCTDGKVHEVVVIVADVSGRKTNLRFWLKSRRPGQLVIVPDPIVADTATFFRYDQANDFNTPEIHVNLPAGSLFENTWFTYSRYPRTTRFYSARHQLNQPDVPLNMRMKVSIRADQLPVKLQPKALLARIDVNGRVHPAGGGYSNGYVTGEVNRFDTYAITVDVTPPVIRAIRDRSRHKKCIRFKVSDNFSGIEDYHAEVNGEWALVEWDPKNRMMVYWYDERMKHGKNSFRLTLTDAKGNRAVYSTTLTR